MELAMLSMPDKAWHQFYMSVYTKRIIAARGY